MVWQVTADQRQSFTAGPGPVVTRKRRGNTVHPSHYHGKDRAIPHVLRHSWIIRAASGIRAMHAPKKPPPRTSASPAFGAPRTAPQAPNPYRALEIIPGPNACAVAKRFAKHRFLLGEAPTPPLAGCDLQGTCTCKFRKMDDRRSDFRRSSDEGMPDFGLVVLERRKTTRRAKIRGSGKK